MPVNFSALNRVIAALEKGEVDAKKLPAKEPIRNVVIILGPDKAYAAITNSALLPTLKKMGAKVTVIGDGKSEVTEAQIKDGLAAIKEPTTLFVMTHGVKDGERLNLSLGRKDPSYIDEAIFKHVPKTVDGICIASCNGEAAFGEEKKGKLYTDALPKGTEVRAPC